MNEKKRGRPRLEFQKSTEESIVSFVKGGGTLKDWCKAAGVSYSTVHRCMQRDPSFGENFLAARLSAGQSKRLAMEQKIATNEIGKLVGQDHFRARHTDREVEIAKVLHEGGMGYARIANLMECSKATVRDWIKGRRRNHEIVKWKVVK